MPIPGGNHTIVGQRCAQAPQQLFALMLSIQSVKPFAVKTNVCILREIFLEETIGTVELCQYLGHKKLNFSPSITYAERIISYADRASSSTCCGVL